MKIKEKPIQSTIKLINITHLFRLGTATNARILAALGTGSARILAALGTTSSRWIRRRALAAASLAGTTFRRHARLVRAAAAPAGIVEMTTTSGRRGRHQSSRGALIGLGTTALTTRRSGTSPTATAAAAGRRRLPLAGLGASGGGRGLAIVRAVTSGGIITRRDLLLVPAILLRESDREADDQGHYGKGGDAELEEFLLHHGWLIE